MVMNLQIPKIVGSSWVSAQLAACQEVVSSMREFLFEALYIFYPQYLLYDG
jgi:hypothetical protein